MKIKKNFDIKLQLLRAKLIVVFIDKRKIKNPYISVQNQK